MNTPRRTSLVRASLILLALGAAACGDDSSTNATSSSTTTTVASSATTTTAKSGAGPLVGTFGISAGDCAGGAVTKGSYFRMVQASGSVSAGPFVSNADSSCGDKSYSSLAPGSDGGLVTGTFQAQPDPPFDSAKNGLAARIIAPTKFFAVGFAASTNAKDPQTGADVTAPQVEVDASGKLTGKVPALSVAWNGQQFNQGSPKPDGSKPGITSDISGTYEAGTGAYQLDWASQIVGGPFNGFTGVWHLEGIFTKTK